MATSRRAFIGGVLAAAVAAACPRVYADAVKVFPVGPPTGDPVMDTAMLRAAVAAASAVRGTVIVGPGKWVLASTIEIADGVNVQGDRMPVFHMPPKGAAFRLKFGDAEMRGVAVK